MFLALSFLQDSLDPVAAGDEPGNDHMFEGIDAPRGGGDLGSQPTQPYLTGGDLEYKIDAGFKPVGGFVNTGRRGSQAVAASRSGPPNRAVLDAGDADSHDRANLSLDLDMTRGREGCRSHRLGAIAGPGPIKRHPGRGAGFPESIAAGEDLPRSVPELSHQLFTLVLEKIATMLGKSDLGPTGQQLSASRATFIHGESPRLIPVCGLVKRSTTGIGP